MSNNTQSNNNLNLNVYNSIAINPNKILTPTSRGMEKNSQKIKDNTKIKSYKEFFYMEEKKISTEYITLGQFLKFANIIETGGREKEFLKTNVVLVNSIEENRRGRKLYRGDVVEVNNKSFKIC